MNKITLPNGENIHCIDELTAYYIYNEIFVEKEYLKSGIKINNDDIIFDVGANIGLFSRFVLNQASNLKIFAFEPIPQIFEVLELNLKNIDAKVKLFNIGLGEEEKDIVFFYYPKVSGDSTAIPFELERKTDLYVKHYKETICQDIPIAKIVPRFLRKWVIRKGLKKLYQSEKVSCHLVPLSNVIEKYNIEHINLLKIDAENYEKHVIEGIKEHDWNKIEQISMEIHTHIPEGENLLNEITEILKEKGFKLKYGDETRETILGVYMLYAIKK